GPPGRGGGAPHPDRVRPAGAPGQPAAGGDRAGRSARRRLGLVGRGRHPDRRQPREGAAAQARGGRDPGRARRRLRPEPRLGDTVKLARWTALLPRPLDPVRSIKLKLGLLVVASGATGITYFWINIGWLPIGTATVAISLALLTTLVLAHGT